MQGKSSAFSLLFPMEAVFESYVASVLAKQLQPALSLKTQARAQYLVRHNGKDRFQLSPDLLIQQGGRNLCVLDTKWKLVDANSESSMYGLSQSDFYQMFAYGHKYLKGQGELILIYPSHDEFQEAISQSFDFDEQATLTALGSAF